jgi:phosphonate transport system substrate-binding protein
VHVDSPFKTLDDLRGKTFAFTDPQSNTGKLVPTYMLAKMKETPDSFFGKYIFTYAHDKSIKAVADKIVSGAAVDSLIWDFYNKTNPDITAKTKLILKSPPYGIPPVVVSSGIDSKTKNKLKNIFLNLHKNEEGKRILKGMLIDKFVKIEDKSYHSIRKMIAWIEK